MEYLISKSYKFSGDAFEIFTAIKNQPYCFFLDSSLKPQSLSRYSFLGFDPVCVKKGKGVSALLELENILSQHKIKTDSNSPPFIGGAVGFLSYDYETNFGVYDTIISIDHYKNNLSIYSLNKHRLKKAIDLLAKGSKPQKPQDKKFKTSSLTSNFSKLNYIKAINRAKEYIRQGDIYQVNLSQKFCAHTKLAAGEIYQRLRDLSPSCFSAYFDAGDKQVISSSPERFLSLRKNIVHTRPMKGTRPRSHDKTEDARHKNDLLSSKKDAAELLMIVDLMRNDLGRVCKYGSVKVESLRNIEEYNTVYQTTADVVGLLYPEMSRSDLIKACFPGGSITGCPKIRAMEVIKELENTARGLYTGSLGYLSFCGNMDLNILIRTIVKQGDNISFSVGGGIVADSRPDDEHNETLVKAKAMMQAI